MNSFRLVMIGLLAVMTGCTLHPKGEQEEREAASAAGKPFEKPDRSLPELPANPTAEQLVEYALINNAELEQHFWEWRSAIEQIPQDATQSASLNLQAGTNITRGHVGWGSSTVGLSNDPMTDIKWPGKLDAAAKQSLENARAAGERFLKSKYQLRNKVLGAYYDYALNAELIRLEQGNQQLLQTMVSASRAGNRSGSSGQSELLKVRNEVDLSDNDIANQQSQLPSQRAAINALLGRPVDAALDIPAELPAVRGIAYKDADIIDLMATHNPELLALADEIRGRGEGVRLAKLQYVPDLNLSGGTDLMGVTQSLLGQVTIPIFRYEALNAAIAQADANLRASQAMRRQAGSDLAAQVVADLIIVRDADRQLALFDQTILPRSRQIVGVYRAGYETGRTNLLEVLDSQRSLITIQQLIAKVKVSRETHLVELESIAATELTHSRPLPP